MSFGSGGIHITDTVKGTNGKILGVVGAAYYDGFDDCLDVVLSILADSSSLGDVLQKVEHTQVLVKGKKLEDLRRDLGVIGKSPF